MSPALDARVDHLVVAATRLEEAVAWCEATLGVTPGPGGQHPLMGTHNRLLRITGDAFPDSYLELIAIDPAAPAPGRRRWFDLDDPALQARLAQDGPQLVHWVARVSDVHAAAAALAVLDIDRGDVLAASRATADGLLRWQITVRPDGQRLHGGALPTLIQWQGAHPAARLPDAGLALQALALRDPQPARLRTACARLGLDLAVTRGLSGLSARLDTPRGPVTLSTC